MLLGLSKANKPTTIAGMKRVRAVFPIFSIFLLLSLLILFFFQNPLTNVLQIITLPIQKWAFIVSTKPVVLTPQQQLQQENNQLRARLAQMQEIQKDNQALHDQFLITSPPPQQLLPADIIGTQQNALLIDKGTADHVRVGNIVVVKNNIIGKIAKSTPHIALVLLLSDPSTSFTAVTAKTGIHGIVKTLANGTVVFGNVVLSDKLAVNDIIVTKGDQNLQGIGYPPGLIVGKIVSIDKQASSLFQSGEIRSLVDVSRLRMVFVKTQ